MSSLANAALGDVLVEARPGFACGDDAADGVFQFRMNNITTEGQLDLSKKRRVPRDSRNIDRYLVEPGDVLFNATNSPDLVGKTAYFPGLEEPAVFSNHFLRLRPDPDRLDGRFLSRWLNVQFQRGRFKGMCRQWVNQATVNRDALLALQIPLPPLPEQRRIAEILDKADALRAKRHAALAYLDTLTQSIFLDMFGDPVDNPMGLRRESLKSAFEFTTGKLDSNAAVEGGKYPFFTCARETSAIDDYAFDCEALLLAGNNANADYSVKHYKGRFNAYQRTYVITIKESALTYAYARLVLEYLLGDLKRFSKGTNTKYLTLVILNRMPILVPPLDLQHRFAAIVESVEHQKARQRAHLAELDTLFASLQSRAFRGEL